MEVLARWVSRYAGWIVAVVVVLLVLCGLYSATTEWSAQRWRLDRARLGGGAGRAGAGGRLRRAWIIERHAAGPRRQVQRAVDRIRPARRGCDSADRRRSAAADPQPDGLEFAAFAATG